MNTYFSNDVLRIAKRQHNTKRTYLLVNPLQAKHMPVSPTRSLEMMKTLGSKLARSYPNCKLIIGFAETATAIGAAVASCFSDDCVYIHTTREDVPKIARWIFFREEHSHATEQKLCGESLEVRIERSEQIIFVDDEISTGKTLINMVNQLRNQFSALRGKQLVVASIINRLTKENMARLSQVGITTKWLVKIDDKDYTELVSAIQTDEAVDLMGLELPEADFSDVHLWQKQPNPREGIEIGRYQINCLHMAESTIHFLHGRVIPSSKVLILGTEECMYPALILGQQIERDLDAAVYCHATTRSPIGISCKEGYPIRMGYKLHSFYTANRETYIYNLARYDAVIVVTDTNQNFNIPLSELNKVLRDCGCCGELFVVNGGF